MADVLFVCSGNTCRSPMAKALFNRLCEQRGLPYRAESAGLHAHDGSPATDGAFFAMQAKGIDLKAHQAQPLTRWLVQDARLIVAMGEHYAQSIRSRFPNAKVIAFDPPISDPYGSSPAVYQRTAEELAARMEWVLAQRQALDAAAKP